MATQDQEDRLSRIVKKIDKDKPEIGSAEIRVDLTDSVITVYHSEGGAVLAKWKAELGDWDKLWSFINDMVEKREGFRFGK